MYEQERGIYLHFFDRELRNFLNIGQNFSDICITDVVSTAMLMTGLPLYVSFSHMYESLDEYPQTIGLLFECEKLGIVKMLTNARRVDEFIASHQQLYKFDENRYCHYFNPIHLMWPTDLYILNDDTTDILRRTVRNSLLDNPILLESTKEQIQTKILRNKEDAITFPFFEGIIKSQYNDLLLSNANFQKYSSEIKKTISTEYSTRYLLAFDGTIVTGIPSFSIFDYLAKDTLKTNYLFYSLLLSSLKGSTNDFFRTCLNFRLDGHVFSIFRSTISTIVAALHHLYENDSHIVDKSCLLINLLKPKMNVANLSDFLTGILALNVNITQTAEKKGFKRMGKKIILTVATTLELQAALKIVGKLGVFLPTTIGKQSCFICHMVNCSIYLIKCQMGSGGVGGSTLTLFESVTDLQPDYVIMGGIAFGSDADKQSIGDVLISSQVWEYDPEKLKEDTAISRGAKYPCSPYLLQKFDIVQSIRNDLRCQTGLIASGSKLVD